MINTTPECACAEDVDHGPVAGRSSLIRPRPPLLLIEISPLRVPAAAARDLFLRAGNDETTLLCFLLSPPLLLFVHANLSPTKIRTVMRSGTRSSHRRSTSTLLAASGILFLLSFGQANAQLLGNGSYFQSGPISANWLWQASGTLTRGRCPWIISRFMADCYKMYANSFASQLGITLTSVTSSGHSSQLATWNRQLVRIIWPVSKHPLDLACVAV